MAQYVEKVYASDVWQENRANGQPLGVVRGASVKTSVKHSFSYDGYPWGIDAVQASFLGMEFPLSEKYGKKKLVAAKISAYVTDVSTSASGSFKSGKMIFGVDDYATDRFQSDAIAAQLEAAELNEGAYNVLINWEDNLGGNLSKAAANGKMAAAPNVWAGCTGDMIVGNSYRAEAAVQIQSHTGTNRPYAEYTYEDVTPTVKSCTPKSGFVDEKTDNLFGWSFAYNQTAVADTIKQKAYGFRWRAADASSWNEVTVQSGICSHTVEAGTFPERGSVQWCVRVQSDDGIWSEWSSVMTLTTVDSIPAAGKLSPDQCRVDGSSDMEFSWVYEISSGTKQSRYELEYSTDGGSNWVALAAEETDRHSALIAANTLKAGQVSWRAKVFNSDGVASGWSDAARITVLAAPSEPVLQVATAGARPLLRWQSEGQVSWCLSLTRAGKEIYTTGELPGTEKEYRIPIYLTDESYEGRLWVKNRYGLLSPTATASFSVDGHAASSPQISVKALSKAAEVTVQGKGFKALYIIRDGKPIHKLIEPGSWIDYSACGMHQYMARGVTAEDRFADSELVFVTVIPSYIQLAAVDALSNPLELRIRRGEMPRAEGAILRAGEMMLFTGRQGPVYEFSEHLEESKKLYFSFREKEEFDRLIDLVKKGKPMLYRSWKGERAFAAITGIEYNMDPVSWDVMISMVAIDHNEEIAYTSYEEVTG